MPFGHSRLLVEALMDADIVLPPLDSWHLLMLHSWKPTVALADSARAPDLRHSVTLQLREVLPQIHAYTGPLHSWIFGDTCGL